MKLGDHLTNAFRQLDRAVRVRGLGHTLSLALRVLVTEGPAGVRRRLDALGPALRSRKPAAPGAVLILTMPHVLHFARRLQSVLAEAGIEAELSDNDRAARDFDTIFAFAPQNFPATPPDRTIAFQVEQSVLPHRWTPEYLAQLSECRAVLEYSLTNMAALQGKVATRKLFHVPLRPPALTPPEPGRRRVLFYGDATPARRAALLARIRETVPELEIETNLFGPRMAALLDQTAIVLNLHSEPGGLLEVARISEAMAHGCVVISETAPDQAETGDLQSRLVLAPEGDAEALAGSIRALLDSPDRLRRQQENSFAPAPDLFRLGVLRALLGLDMISPAQFEALAGDYPSPIPTGPGLPRTCLTLPETPLRSRAFLAHNPPDYLMWPGLKASPGWRGAALSYRHIMRRLRDAGITEALVVEDDVILPPGFHGKLQTIRNYMDACDADLFSGLIVDLHKEAKVLGVERRDGLVLVQLDRAVMMICNLYRQRMIEHLAAWDDQDDNAFTNTIDRYMEAATYLRVVTTLPFMVDYGASLQSTLRDADNHKFDALRSRSEALLAEKVSAFEADNPAG